MLDGLKRMWRGYRLLRQGVAELRGIRLALESIAAGMARGIEVQPPLAPQAEDDPRLDAPYVDVEQQAALQDIHSRLTVARGMLPTEEEVLAEFDRRYGGSQGSV